MTTSQNGRSTEKRELQALSSTQEETDSRVILYCMCAMEKGYDNVRVKSPDSDIFFILLHFAPSLDNIVVFFDTGTGNRKRLINMSELARGFTQLYCIALMALHAFTGCDTSSAFKGVGKVKPIKLLQKVPRFQSVLARLGDDWEVPVDLMDDLEDFTCSMYSKPRFSKVDELRHFTLKQKCGVDAQLSASKNVDMGTIPPCRACLQQHIRRVNYQVGVWKRANRANPDVPDPTDGHGWTMNGDSLEPLWTDAEILPQSLVDIMQESVDSDEESELDDDQLPSDYLLFDNSSDDD